MNPNLAGQITLKDVQKKEGKDKKFVAKYMAWATVGKYFNEHCSGWTFHLRQTPEGNHVWTAPNKTGYLVCYFKDPNGREYSDIPYSIMGQRSQPVPVERISARTFTDNARRAFCLSCAFQFSLGYELWANEEINEANEVFVDAKPEPQFEKKEQSVDDLIEKIMGLLPNKFGEDEAKMKTWITSKANIYNLKGEGSKLKQMSNEQLQECLRELNNDSC